jgi:hypothetical protein
VVPTDDHYKLFSKKAPKPLKADVIEQKEKRSRFATET